ncbi:LytTR family DNA-binding domain-containing protein [Bacteroidales bacterium OttesenSCG-928-B11]|nr:LytTR family DNA-binding domain-containing protein [Bacteroidales bacterium OttesenSCG-928-C03]MDL2312726.1 LytTR family DNA-binding domain-containing protein [Bacteroidales bacterium OttesenSCG-928-B11]
MKTLIIEDEHVMAQTLKGMIEVEAPDLEIVGILQSIEESVDWLLHNPMPDLLFMDIHLADGPSFSVFDEVTVTCPIIFTTAYDQYALRAFEVYSIDYLLKPIDQSDLQRALAKFRRISKESKFDKKSVSQLLEQMKEMAQSPIYKSCFLFPERDKLIPVNTQDIGYFYSENRRVKIFTFQNRTYFSDLTLDELMASLNPRQFFRVNRQFIISRNAIKDMTLWFGNKLSINLSIEIPERVVVSRAKVKEFKKWFER